MQGTRRPVTRTVPLQLRPELGPAGIASALRRQHVMIGDAQVSDNPAFQASKETEVATPLPRRQRQEAWISGGLTPGWSRGEAELGGHKSLQTSPAERR